MKDGQKPRKSFLPFVDICFRTRDMSFQSLRNLEKKMRQENWTFCAPLTKIVTSHLGLLQIQYLNQMSLRHYWSESSKTWYTYETRWEELENIKYFVAMATFSVRAFIN